MCLTTIYDYCRACLRPNCTRVALRLPYALDEAGFSIAHAASCEAKTFELLCSTLRRTLGCAAQDEDHGDDINTLSSEYKVIVRSGDICKGCGAGAHFPGRDSRTYSMLKKLRQ